MRFKDFPEPGGGNPFKLSLLADLVGPENEFTVDDIRDLRRVEVAYLILRVIERVPESQCSLRWLLRYAVIPRQLTKGFVEAITAAPDEPTLTVRESREVTSVSRALRDDFQKDLYSRLTYFCLRAEPRGV